MRNETRGSKPRTRLGAAATAILALLGAPGAFAHGPGIAGPDTGWYLPAGLDLGLAFGGGDDVGALVGAELSLVYLGDALIWAGLVSSAQLDLGRDDTRLAIGPELGYLLFGVEALAERRDGAWGGRYRALATVGLGALYVGVSTAGDLRYETGLLLKFPFGA